MWLATWLNYCVSKFSECLDLSLVLLDGWLRSCRIVFVVLSRFSEMNGCDI